MKIARHKTARARHELSRPVRRALEDGLISESTAVFDYGCGRGDDVRLLKKRGISCGGWDPGLRKRGKKRPAEVVNLGYVVNVIEDASERRQALQEAWGLSAKCLVVAARLLHEAKGLKLKSHGDGFLTQKGTFQKFYLQDDLRQWVDETLGVTSVAAGPGIFYVFRSDADRQSFAASRYRRRSATPRVSKSVQLFEAHRELLEPLMASMAERGRLPSDVELANAPEVVEELGSLKRAAGVVRRATGKDRWAEIAAERAQDLLVYLGLSRFGGRPRMSELPRDIQLDVKAFFSTYKRASSEADALLFAAGDMQRVDRAVEESPVGKKTHKAIYFHVSAMPELPPILRVYEGCARNYLGVVDAANVVKLHRMKPKVSYLLYQDFEKNPHPPLLGSLGVNLQAFDVWHKDYSESENPFILHRKETLVAAEHPDRDKYTRLTVQEERMGLLLQPGTIGTAQGWAAVLEEHAVTLRGHRIVKVKR